MRNDDQVQDAIRHLFEGVAPERGEELRELWNNYNPRFNLLTDVEPEGLFIFDAGAYRDVRFNHRAVRAFWLASFIAWEGYRAIFEGIEANTTDLSHFREMTESFANMLKETDPEAVALPKGVPEPGVYPDSEDFPQMRAASELATIATGWALLHEIHHLKHQQDGTGATVDDPPDKWRSEEFSCDSFATTFLLDRVDEFASSENVSAEKVNQKRELGIYFALFALSLIGVGSWAETDSHPAIGARISAIMKQMGSDGTRNSDAIAHAAFVALWSIWPDAPGHLKDNDAVRHNFHSSFAHFLQWLLGVQSSYVSDHARYNRFWLGPENGPWRIGYYIE